MSRIRSKNTKSELIVFHFLRRNGVYFQKHYAKAPGSPDIALPRKKKAIFIDGDFWHGRTYEKIKHTRSDDDYWVFKLEKNIARDIRQNQELKDRGWQVLRVWDSDIQRKRTRDEILREIQMFLQD